MQKNADDKSLVEWSFHFRTEEVHEMVKNLNQIRIPLCQPPPCCRRRRENCPFFYCSVLNCRHGHKKAMPFHVAKVKNKEQTSFLLNYISNVEISPTHRAVLPSSWQNMFKHTSDGRPGRRPKWKTTADFWARHDFPTLERKKFWCAPLRDSIR